MLPDMESNTTALPSLQTSAQAAAEALVLLLPSITIEEKPQRANIRNEFTELDMGSSILQNKGLISEMKKKKEKHDINALTSPIKLLSNTPPTEDTLKIEPDTERISLPSLLNVHPDQGRFLSPTTEPLPLLPPISNILNDSSAAPIPPQAEHPRSESAVTKETLPTESGTERVESSEVGEKSEELLVTSSEQLDGDPMDTESTAPVKKRTDINNIIAQTHDMLPAKTEPRFFDITHLLTLPQADAAKAVRLSKPTFCKRWKEAVGNERKWPHRYILKIDREIRQLRSQQKRAGSNPTIEKRVAQLTLQRKIALTPTSIRL